MQRAERLVASLGTLSGCAIKTGMKSETKVKLAHGSAEPCARKGASVRLAEKPSNVESQLFSTNPVNMSGGGKSSG
ncbi:hypothetical protein [Janthinobacterium sp. 67]|uniref:hypothetical protein n=1 Tax=Janthinobacterium sp. 67 TaxID=2035207 RepID=UPI0012FD0BA2|nr:hypothetical protein [Janthinobacterium sp. 67]